MKLNDYIPTIETSEQLQEQLFSIGNMGIIFDILRNKMYSNTILAICREISCNARDAHREVGDFTTPIHITLPNSLEPFYKIKDFGPGINPERIENIFVKYGSSTKREDNIQVGSFGLGSKTPFAYSDTFTVITTVNGIRYDYVCFIDETKVGKIVLMQKSETSEPNGTEIVVPVRPTDFRNFIEQTELATRHWEIKPIITGGEIEYKTLSKLMFGDNWTISSNDNYYDNNVRLIIDGIEYKLNENALKTCSDAVITTCIRGALYLYFDTGEISLSANREQIYLDKQTQEKVHNRLVQVTNEIKSRIINDIDQFDNFWDANVHYRTEICKLFHDIKFLGTLTWRNVPLFHNTCISLGGYDTFFYCKGKTSYRSRFQVDKNKISRSNHRSRISFVANCALYINDLSLKEPTAHHVKKAFDDPKVTSVQVICVNDLHTEEKLNKDIHLDLMKPRRLSEITKASRGSKPREILSSRLILFKYKNSFSQVSYDSIKEDNNHKILFFIRRSGNQKQVILDNGNILLDSDLSTLRHHYPDLSFYGIDKDFPRDRIKKLFSKFQMLDDFLKEKLPVSRKEEFCKIKYAIGNYYDIDDKQLKYFEDYYSLVNTNSFFIKRLKLHKEMKTLGTSDPLLNIYQKKYGVDLNVDDYLQNHPEHDMAKVNAEYIKTYPLMEYISSFYNNKLVLPVADYINFIDSRR